MQHNLKFRFAFIGTLAILAATHGACAQTTVQAAPAATNAPAAPAAGTFSLIVDVANVRSNNGTILASLQKVPDGGGAPVQVAGVMMAATAGHTILRFDGLTAGTYGVRMFHDENNNHEMDKSAFGMPTEGFGFSNNAHANFGPPEFSQLAVTISATGAAEVTTTATMQYLN